MTQQQSSSDVRIRFNSSNTVSLSESSSPQNFIREINGEILASNNRIGEVKARCINISGARESGIPISQLFSQPSQTSQNQEFQTAISDLFGSQQSFTTGSQQMNQEGRQQNTTNTSSTSSSSKSTDLNTLDMVFCVDSIQLNNQQYQNLEPQIVKQCLRTFATDGTYVIVNTQSQQQPKAHTAASSTASATQGSTTSSSQPQTNSGGSMSPTSSSQWFEFGFQPIGSSSSNYYGGEYAYNRVPQSGTPRQPSSTGSSQGTNNQASRSTSQQAHTGTSSRSA